MSSSDTIFALATGHGKSAVAIVRVSGKHALHALNALTDITAPIPRYAHLATLRAPSTKDPIDCALIFYFNAPHSFTGEDVVEFHLHGGRAVISELLSVLGDRDNLRPAQAGEFSRRAFLNGKMDLMEAEAIADLIDAETHEQKAQALKQMQGALSNYYQSLRAQVIRCLAQLEAYIDFPDEDIPSSVLLSLGQDIATLHNTLATLLKDDGRGERLREGLQVVILGPPNAGKSSLLNVLARRDVAIVSHRAGTTRDVLEVCLDISGYPVVLKDTAGIHLTHDEIEAQGIKRAMVQAAQADINLLLLDAGALDAIDSDILNLLDDRTMVVINKTDVKPDFMLPFNVANVVAISCNTGDGIELLLKNLSDNIKSRFEEAAPIYITRGRHRAMIARAWERLGRVVPSMPLELQCEELRLAANYLGEITGIVTVDQVLDDVFKHFCIGK